MTRITQEISLSAGQFGGRKIKGEFNIGDSVLIEQDGFIAIYRVAEDQAVYESDTPDGSEITTTLLTEEML